MKPGRLGFIGAGRMATALAAGVVRAGLVAAGDLLAADPSPEALEQFAAASGGIAVADNQQVAARADCLVLATKPQQAAAVLADLQGHCKDKLVVSIMAGVRLQTLADGIGQGARWMRVMPNTPCLVGVGASAYCLGPGATSDDAKWVEALLGAVGRAWQVEEKLLDAVTGLSGSGPAFVYLMIEALSDGGVRMGLPRAVATGLAAQTVLGAAHMTLATGLHPGELKDQVTSPGGTTIAGLQALEAGAVRADLMAAVQAATERSVELGRGSL